MDVGSRLREFREHRNLTQGDIEKRTGLVRSYVSRVENGYTVPNVEAFEKFARAIGVPLYHLFYEGETPQPHEESANPLAWNDSRKDRNFARHLRRLLGQMNERDRSLLLGLAQRLARRKMKRD